MTHANVTLVSRHGPWVCAPDMSDTTRIPWYHRPRNQAALAMWVVPFHGKWLVRYANEWNAVERLEIPEHRSVRVVVLYSKDLEQIQGWIPPWVDTVVIEKELGSLPDLGLAYEAAQADSACSWLERIVEWVCSELRIDFSNYQTANQAWRAGAVQQYQQVGSYQYRNIERWFRTVNDHPWQEVRTVGSKSSLAGVVLDMRNAYANAMVNSMYPYPGPWSLSATWVKHPCAMGWCRFYPRDALARFAHPFATLDSWFSRRYIASDCLEGWFHVDTIKWMQKHGKVELLKCATPTRWGPHPLKGKTEYLMRSLQKVEPCNHSLRGFYKTSIKRKLASSHAWGWTPTSHWECSTPEDSRLSHLEEYGAVEGSYFRTSGSYVDPDLGWMTSNIDDTKSGSYMWTSWTRMLVRSLLLNAVAELVDAGLHLDKLMYLNVDSMHWKTDGDLSSIHSWLDKNASAWKIDYTFDDAFYAAPGVYQLLRGGAWQGEGCSSSQLLRWNLGRSNLGFQKGVLRARRWSSHDHAVYKSYHEASLLNMLDIHRSKV